MNCPTCDGRGMVMGSYDHPVVCRQCNGTGNIVPELKLVEPEHILLCPECNGTGDKPRSDMPCGVCHGTGIQQNHRPLED